MEINHEIELSNHDLFPDWKSLPLAVKNPDKFLCSGANYDEDEDLKLMTYFVSSSVKRETTNSKKSIKNKKKVVNRVKHDDFVALLNKHKLDKANIKALPLDMIDGRSLLSISNDFNKSPKLDDLLSVSSSATCPSEFDDNDNDQSILLQEDFIDNKKCMSKSAVTARVNRRRKKDHVQELENMVTQLTTEKTALTAQVSGMNRKVTSLQREVEYLASVISNQSALSAVLRNVCRTPGISFSGSSLVSPSPTDEQEEDINKEEVEEGKEEEEEVPSQKRSCLVDLRKGPSVQVDSPQSDADRSKDNKSYDHDYAERQKTLCASRSSRERAPVETEQNRGGVCLHVVNNTVSFEFCSQCNSRCRLK